MLCPKCGKDSGLEAWLDKVRAVKARKKWFWSYCPNCNAPYELEINRGNVILGGVDGFPGPAFIPHKTYKMPGLSVQWEEGRVHVAHEGRRWTFKTIWRNDKSPPARHAIAAARGLSNRRFDATGMT